MTSVRKCRQQTLRWQRYDQRTTHGRPGFIHYLPGRRRAAAALWRAREARTPRGRVLSQLARALRIPEEFLYDAGSFSSRRQPGGNHFSRWVEPRPGDPLSEEIYRAGSSPFCC